MKRDYLRNTSVVLLALSISGAADAHTGHLQGGGLIDGLTHPLLGWDHMLTALAVGLWASRQRTHTVWALPLAFVMVMLAGVGIARAGTALMQPEVMMVVSLLVLGGLLYFDIRMARVTSIGLVSLFAIFHGYLHGMEMPLTSTPMAYAAGLLCATFLLHSGGVLLGRNSQIAWIKGYGLVIGSAGLMAVLG
jgi:urease accessory protein